MSALKYEKRLLIMVYLLCIGLFANLAILKNPIDKLALVIGLVIIVIIGFSHFIIRRFYPDGDKYIFILSSVLSIISIATLYSINVEVAIKQLMWLCVGISVYMMIVILAPNMKFFAKYKTFYMVSTIIFMALAEIFGTYINGAKNWIRIGSFTFQPSEVGKILLILYLASVLVDYQAKHKFKEDLKQLLEPAIIVAISLAFMVLQKDLGSALLIFLIAATILYMATSNKKYIIVSLLFFIVGAVIATFLFAHVRERVMIWLNVWKYAQDQSYQIVQGFYAIASGGPVGMGLGQGMPWQIPINTTDFIYAVICQEFGMIFSIGILFIYFLIFYRGMRTALVTEDRFSRLCAVGFSTLIAVQVLVIIGGIFSVIPLTGITLPLISYGGTGTLIMFFALGTLQKISEEGR